LGDPWPTPTEDETRAAQIICDRWQGLIRLLLKSNLTAVGTFATTGLVQTIDSLQWSRRGQWVDVQSGDLVERANNAWVVRWSGLRLIEPNNDALVPSAPTPSFDGGPRAAYKTPRTAVEKRIHTAASRIWPDGLPDGMMKKVRDEQIITWLRQHKFGPASARSIRRYLGS
jgi:hypothetical protein